MFAFGVRKGLIHGFGTYEAPILYFYSVHTGFLWEAGYIPGGWNKMYCLDLYPYPSQMSV